MKKITLSILLILLVCILIGCNHNQKILAPIPTSELITTPSPTVLPTFTPIPTVQPTPMPTPTIQPTPTLTPIPPTPSPTPLLPIILKSPTSEIVEEGGSCYFVARYDNATVAVWHFVSPDGQVDMTYINAQKVFSPVEIINGMYSTMQLKNIPYSLNGWKVYCRYSNDNGSTNTGIAYITVMPKPMPIVITPYPEPTTAPTPVIEPAQTTEEVFYNSAYAYVDSILAAQSKITASQLQNYLVNYDINTDHFILYLRYDITQNLYIQIYNTMNENNISLSDSILQNMNFNLTSIKNAKNIILTLQNNGIELCQVDFVTKDTIFIKSAAE